MSPGHALLARGRPILDSWLGQAWSIEGSGGSYVGNFDTRNENSLVVGGFGPEASATLVVSAPAVEASGIAIGKRVVVSGRTYIVTAVDPQPQASIFHLQDPNT